MVYLEYCPPLIGQADRKAERVIDTSRHALPKRDRLAFCDPTTKNTPLLVVGDERFPGVGLHEIPLSCRICVIGCGGNYRKPKDGQQD